MKTEVTQMNGSAEQADASSSWGQANGGAAFQFDRGDDWVRLSADFGRLGQAIGDQMRRALADVNVEAIAEQVRQAVTDVASEVRAAMDNLTATQAWEGPTRVRVDIRAESTPQPSPAQRPADHSVERLTVLNLVAQGKITAEEAAKLLDALGE
jgi:hypothetical protein